MVSFSKILFPVDFSKRCGGAAHAVRAMAMQFQAEVTALHVVEVASANSAYESLVAQAREKMDRLVTQELRSGVVVPYFERGDPAQIILSYARNGHSRLRSVSPISARLHDGEDSSRCRLSRLDQRTCGNLARNRECGNPKGIGRG